MDQKELQDGKSAIAKIEKLVADGDMIVFTSDEAEALKAVAKWWRILGATASLGSVVGSTLKWVVVFVALIAGVKAGLLGWISNGLGIEK